MAAISSQALKPLYYENKMRYNGNEQQSKEFSDGSGLENYNFNARTYDPQIGRFLNIDPLTDFTPNNTPYAFVGNNPMLFCDPLGLDTVRVTGEGSHKIKIRQGDVLAWTVGKNTSYYTYDPSNKEAVSGFVENGIANTEQAVTVTPTQEQTDRKKEAPGSNYAIPALGIGLSLGEHKMFNENTWYSIKTWKTYSQRFNGNQYTGGKLKLAEKVSKGFRYGGWALSVYNALNIYKDKEISGTQKVIEEGSNAFGTLGGIYGVAHVIGWESGRAISQNDWYRENVRPVIQDALGVERDEYPRQSKYANMQFAVPKNQ